MKTKNNSVARLNRAGLKAKASCFALSAALGIIVIQPAHAAGTLAGTDIENIASATYDTPSGTVTIQSNMVSIKVDELLDVVVDATDSGDITTAPGFVGNVQRYRVTNTGNGDEAFALTANVANGGDDFDPTLQKIVIDTNDDGVYDPGIDTDYIPGTNEQVIGPDQSKTFFIITNTPVGVVDLDRADVGLTAVAVTGSGAPGTTFTGAGQGGGDAVVGLNSATDADSGFLAVQAATLALVKTAAILDPFGGTRPVPGAIITYSIAASVTGSGSLANLVITDPIPVGTTYEVGTITLQTSVLTDAADTDVADYNGTRISVAAGNVPAGQTRTVTFKVKIP
jgi:uncharacterized repeat protein (TIGR01451 family)